MWNHSVEDVKVRFTNERALTKIINVFNLIYHLSFPTQSQGNVAAMTPAARDCSASFEWVTSTSPVVWVPVSQDEVTVLIRYLRETFWFPMRCVIEKVHARSAMVDAMPMRIARRICFALGGVDMRQCLDVLDRERLGWIIALIRMIFRAFEYK